MPPSGAFDARSLARANVLLGNAENAAGLEMLARDVDRLADCRRRVNVLPLGSAALAGTTFPIDRHMVAAELGFDRPSANSLDSVSDRDFAVELAAFAGQTHVQ